MKRTTLNYVVDVAAFVAFAFLATSGILLRFQLPPGSGRRELVGQGQRALDRPVSVLWGLTRHEWGSLHYYLALGLMLVLALHLVLHWKWIAGVTRGKSADGSGYRVAVGVLGLISVLALAVAPLFVPAESVPRSQLQSTVQDETSHQGSAEEDLIQGEMTLSEVEAATGVPASFILDRLALPENTARDERLGRLRRQYGFSMGDVRKAVADYQVP